MTEPIKRLMFPMNAWPRHKRALRMSAMSPKRPVLPPPIVRFS